MEELIALIEEERLNRIKMSPHSLPINAVKNVLKLPILTLIMWMKLHGGGIVLNMKNILNM